MIKSKWLLFAIAAAGFALASGCSRATLPGKWVPVDTTFPDAFYTVNFVDEKTGWINAQGDRSSRPEDEDQVDNANGNLSAPVANRNTAKKPRKAADDPLKLNQGFEVLRTTDGGDTWKQIPDQFKYKIRSVWFVDPNTGWALTIDRDLLHTSDGGATWVLQRKAGKVKLKLFGNRQTPELEQPDQIERMYFIDSRRGWAWGGGKVDRYTEQPGILLMTLDGGETWNPVAYPFSQNIYSIFFLDGDHIWASTDGDGVYKTTDGGLNWARIQSKLPEDVFRAIFFLDVNNGWIVGRSGRIAKTTDGGRSWQKMYMINLEFEMRDIFFTDKDHGWAVGSNGAILYTPDAGETWLSATPAIQTELIDLVFVNRRVGWAVGLNGAAVRYQPSGG